MNIREFINEKKAAHEQRYRNQTAAEVLLKSVKPHIEDWNAVFHSGGYYLVNPNTTPRWEEIHRWCVENLGDNRYAWNGNNFWFETEQDAIMFTLRWG